MFANKRSFFFCQEAIGKIVFEPHPHKALVMGQEDRPEIVIHSRINHRLDGIHGIAEDIFLVQCADDKIAFPVFNIRLDLIRLINRDGLTHVFVKGLIERDFRSLVRAFQDEDFLLVADDFEHVANHLFETTFAMRSRELSDKLVRRRFRIIRHENSVSEKARGDFA